MFYFRNSIIRNTFSFIATIFILVMVFGISQIGMYMGGATMRCPFSGHSMSICSMNPLEHIEEWQSMFTILPTKDSLLLLSTLLFISVLLVLRYFRKFSIHNLIQLKIQNNYFYLRTALIFNYLQEAFSRGILNPKLFQRHN